MHAGTPGTEDTVNHGNDGEGQWNRTLTIKCKHQVMSQHQPQRTNSLETLGIQPISPQGENGIMKLQLPKSHYEE